MKRFDVFVIGGGGTGSEVAFTLGRRGGMTVGIAERDKLGGECNHYGCVPTKIMLRSAKIAQTARGAGNFGVRIPTVEVDFGAVVQRARDIIEQNSGAGAKPFEDMGITVLLEEVRLTGPNSLETASGERIEADRIVLATGTDAYAPPIDGLEGTPYWTNREALWSPTEVPSSLAVIGSGPIGMEFAQIYRRFGADVTVVEIFDRIIPAEDDDSSAAAQAAFEEEGIVCMPKTKAVKVEHDANGFTVHLEKGSPVRAEALLAATGRRPVFDVHDLDAAGVELDGGGKPVLTETLRTTADNIWAAGDATGDLLFTHVGGYEADLVVKDILGKPTARDYRVVPKVTYTDPEVASVGLTERDALAEGREVVTSMLRFADNERAHIEGKTHGIVKLVASARDGELLGGHIVGEGAGDMIHEIVLAMAARVPARVAAEAIHSYPTLSESVRGAFIGLADKLER